MCLHTIIIRGTRSMKLAPIVPSPKLNLYTYQLLVACSHRFQQTTEETNYLLSNSTNLGPTKLKVG